MIEAAACSLKITSISKRRMTSGSRAHALASRRSCTTSIHRSRSPEKIAATYPSLTLEEVYATITYYLQNKEAITQYLVDWIEHGRRMRAEQARNPTPEMLRLRELRPGWVAAQRKMDESQPS